ncbi:MAG: HipA domain-containing protein [Eubacteriales bacterium]|nr:HipA domain-containing protein [Eubacteriales bacterium]
MNCLHCGKTLSSNNSSGWHKSCIKSFFGTNELPVIDINEKTLELLTNESINKGHTVPGVQKKLSLHLHSHEGKQRLTIVNYPTGYILKPQIEEFEALPEAEHLVMRMASTSGITTVPNALIKDGERFAYITKRVDRVFTKNSIQMFGMEDFCQLDFRLTQDKYKGSYERCAKIIDKYSSRKGLDTTELFMRLVFSFIVGNSDMHLKNFSMIEKSEGSGEYILSPAYDLLPVNVIMPEDKEQFALPMNGKKTNIRSKDFLKFAATCGISEKSAENMINKVVSKQNKFISMCYDSFLPNNMKKSLIELINMRIACF